MGLAYTLPPAGAAAAGGGAAAAGATGSGGGGAGAEGAGAAGLGAGAAPAGLSSLKSLKAAMSDSFSTIMQTSLPVIMKQIYDHDLGGTMSIAYR